MNHSRNPERGHSGNNLGSRSRGVLAGIFAVLLTLATLPALAQSAGDTNQSMNGADISGNVGDRDNTRVQGTVYDPDGNPMPSVHIWLSNDTAPANRVRSKTRKSGTFLVRGVPRLYTQDDVMGIVLRLRFERGGFQSPEVKVAVEKDGLQAVNVVMFPEGAEAKIDGLCAQIVGVVKNSKGKGVKGATVRITSPDDESIAVDTVTEKGGSFEAVFWGIKTQNLVVEVTGGGNTVSQEVELALQPQADAFLPQEVVVDLGG